MTSIQYFAYGSNMLTERLRARCPSAKVRCTAAIDGYRLAFSKKSLDGSGKATIEACEEAGCRVHGVVFEIDESELTELDRFEGAGRGYERINSLQAHADGMDSPLEVTTYIADPDCTDNDLKPYDWYVRLVTAGARQHALPADYVAAIEAVPSENDPEADRKARQEALALLESVRS